MIVKHLDKNSTAISKTMNTERQQILIGVSSEHDLEWFKIIFDLYNKMNRVPRKEDLKNALQHGYFNKMSKECQELVKENYSKFYPK